MFVLKPLPRAAIPEAIEKARQYRLLNEPLEAESICLDILDIEPSNQEAAILLLLARTDQLEAGGSGALKRAQSALENVEGDYEHAFYSGLICERRAKAALRHGRGRGRRSGAVAYEWLRRAMDHYEVALAKRESGDEDATLRWNTCARMIERNPECAPDENHRELGLE